MLNNKNNKLFSVVLQSFRVFIVLKGSHITHPLIPEKKTNYLFSNTALKPNKGMHGFAED